MKKKLYRAISYIFIFVGISAILVRDLIIALGLMSLFVGMLFTFLEHNE